MRFCLRNAPASFQRIMHKVLSGQEDHSTSYIDDIHIFSKTCEVHIAHIQAVLEVLHRRNGVTEKPQKFKWVANTPEYLGHIVGNGQVAVPEGRVQALRDFKRPVKKKDLRSFY